MLLAGAELDCVYGRPVETSFASSDWVTRKPDRIAFDPELHFSQCIHFSATAGSARARWSVVCWEAVRGTGLSTE